MNNCEICDVRDDELELCAMAIRAAFGTVANDFGFTVTKCPTHGAYMKTDRLLFDREKGNLMYVLKENGNIAGFMQLEKKDEERFELKSVSVIPEYRHRGFGKTMLDFAKEKVKQLGGCKISIGIIEENTVLKKWYVDNGFVHLGTKVFDHLPFTVGFMEWVME